MKIYIEIEVPDNFEVRMDMWQVIKDEIDFDRWAWHKSIPNGGRPDGDKLSPSEAHHD